MNQRKRIQNEKEFQNWQDYNDGKRLYWKDVMVDGDYQEEYFDTIADAISSIASIDVKGFELSNEFFYEILEKLK